MRGLAVSIGFVVLGVTAFLWLAPPGCKEAIVLRAYTIVENYKNPLLPDKDLIAHFQKHRDRFDQLFQMIARDPKLYRIDEDWADGDSSISPKRLREYRDRLRKVGCPRGFWVVTDRQRIFFILAARGTVASSVTRGVCYCEQLPDPIATNTLAYVFPSNEGSYTVFRPIEGHWYIYQEIQD